MTMDEQFMVKQQTSDLNSNCKEEAEEGAAWKQATCRDVSATATPEHTAGYIPPFHPWLCKVMQNGNGQRQRQQQRQLQFFLFFLFPLLPSLSHNVLCVSLLSFQLCGPAESVCVWRVSLFILAWLDNAYFWLILQLTAVAAILWGYYSVCKCVLYPLKKCK